MKRVVWVIAMTFVCSAALYGGNASSQKVEDLLGRLSLREKVAQLFVMAVDAHEDNAEIRAKQIYYQTKSIPSLLPTGNKHATKSVQ